MNLQEALNDPVWISHKIGDTYSMTKDSGIWRIAYYPLFGTYEGEVDEKKWVEFQEPRALVEKPFKGGIDLREVPLRYLTKNIALM